MIPFQFPCGTMALDFVGTLLARRDEAIEQLGQPSDLDDWLAESGLRTSGAEADDDDLRAAIELRESIYDGAWARLHDEEPSDAAVAVINARAAELPLRPILRGDGVEREGSARQGLADLAREAVTVLARDQAALLRECSRPGCTQIYLDHSRGQRREWCSMATCGNRVKAAAYRARKAADAD